MTPWTLADTPSQQGRTAVVTGTGGLGYQVALALAGAGASVHIAGRNADKGAEAVAAIRRQWPRAEVQFRLLNLASLDSVQRLADELTRALPRLDLLINNAAVMTPPTRLTTRDGFELQIGTNHLGHFALTGRLLSLLQRGQQPRVVSVSSVAARSGAIRLSELQSQHRYHPMHAYSQSKLACLMFALELQRRSDAGGWGLQSIAAHPGIARTELLPNGAGPWSGPGMARRFLWFLFQPAAQGALPLLYAATEPKARGGGYYGPDRLSETRGHPAPAQIPAAALDAGQCARLWAESERLTGVVFPTQALEEWTVAQRP